MSFLVTSDTHFTASQKDEYRWGLFPWLRRMVKKHDATTIILCGDLTDAKDRHPSVLVNRIADEISETAKVSTLVLIRGNHDCIDEHNPFFKFLSKMDIRYINYPTEFAIGKNVGAAFLPNTRKYEEDWKSLDNIADRMGGDIRYCKYIFCHQTFDGSEAENGTTLRGIPPSFFNGFKGKVISGDVHVPQNINKTILHVGSPYRIHFGDSFTPRVLLVDNDKFIDLHYPCISRELLTVRTVEAVDRTDFGEGTQVKIRVKLKRSEYPEWISIRKQVQDIAAKKRWVLYGPELVELLTTAREHEIELEETRTPEAVLRDYSKDKKLDKDMTNTGLAFLKDAQ